MRDGYNKIEQLNIMDSTSAVATSFETSVVTLGDCNSVNLAINAGTAVLDLSNYIELSVEESDDNVTFTTVTDDNEVIGATLDSSGKWLLLADTINDVSYVGTKKYVKLVGDVTGTVSVPISAHAIKGLLR